MTTRMGYDGLQTLHHKIQNINSTKVGLTFKSVDRTLFKMKATEQLFHVLFIILQDVQGRTQKSNYETQPFD